MILRLGFESLDLVQIGSDNTIAFACYISTSIKNEPFDLRG